MIKAIVVNLIKAYRKYVSPMKRPCCKYYPTCSQYALEAVSQYGVLKGAIMSLYRVLRCNPFSRGGYDPVKPCN